MKTCRYIAVSCEEEILSILSRLLGKTCILFYGLHQILKMQR